MIQKHTMLKSHNKTIYETLGRSPIHPFPARMAPGIALDALGERNAPITVLDPMAGSGTVLAVARANGHRAIGFDIDPLAVLLSNVWTRTTDADAVYDKAIEVLNRAKSLFCTLSYRDAYPIGSNNDTRKFIRFWFDNYARKQLAALSICIRRVRSKAIRNALWCGFSRLIITKTAGASLAMDLSHSRPHKSYTSAPVKPFSQFVSAVERVVSNCPQKGSSPVGPMTIVKHGDARNMPIATESIDLVLTSPPYLNAIDYMRCSKFTLIWMGYSISQVRDIRGDSVGAETASREAMEASWVLELLASMDLKPKLSARNTNILARYAMDMDKALAEVARVLKDRGQAVYVVGDSTVRGTFVRNSTIVSSVAQRHGLVLEKKWSRDLPASRRYMPPPKTTAEQTSIENRMRHEVILAFTKSTA